MRLSAWISGGMLLCATSLGGCDLTDSECGALRTLCQDQCPIDIKRACIELVDQGDERLCSASYSGYAKYCPDWDLFDDEM